MLQTTDLQLSFTSNGNMLHVLSIDRLEIQSREHFVITGPSGAGKTTLLYVLTGIECPDRGKVVWNGQDLTEMNESRRDRWRRKHVGFIFQDFYLIPGLSIIQNVLLPATFDRIQNQRDRALMLLKRVGVDAGGRSISVLSRGERQRVAIARALLRSPEIIVADEPTASLDRHNGSAVVDLLFDMAEEEGITLCGVSHDPAFIQHFEGRYQLENGRLHFIDRGDAP